MWRFTLKYSKEGEDSIIQENKTKTQEYHHCWIENALKKKDEVKDGKHERGGEAQSDGRSLREQRQPTQDKCMMLPLELLAQHKASEEDNQRRAPYKVEIR